MLRYNNFYTKINISGLIVVLLTGVLHVVSTILVARKHNTCDMKSILFVLP